MNFDKFDFNPEEYSALLLTHAHLDHCGRIPKLVKHGFKGKIFCTSATKDLAYIVMMDAAKIAVHDTERENRRRAEINLPPRQPIYEEKDVENVIKLFKIVDYGKLIKINKEINVTFHDAGHILGAASLKIDVEKKILVFSGDLGQVGTPIVRDPTIIKKADYVFIESTYGDRLHPPAKERKNKFLDIINETYKRGGKLLIPSFAIERTQELLYDLNLFVEKNLMPKIDVYIDSPMAIKTTEVFKKHPEFYDKEIKALFDTGDNPFSFPGLRLSKTVDDSKKIDELKKPCIIIAGSGMCTGGRIKYHIKNDIEDPKSTILFVGYQVKGTLGYWIKKGVKKIRLLGTQRFVRARVASIDSFSAHADYNSLLNWLKHFSPKPTKVFVIHGDKEASLEFSNKVQKLGLKTYIPRMREKITL